MMDNIREFLTRKIGPLPAWAWGVLIAAGVWIFRAMAGGSSGVSSTRASSPAGGGGTAVVPSLSGGGALPPTGVGTPEGQQSSLFVSTQGFTAEGDPSSVSGIIDALLAAQRSSTSTGGSATGTTQPDPIAEPVPVTTAPTRTGYRLYWMNNPGGTVGTYSTRLQCSQAAQQIDPNSSPPGSSMGCAAVYG